MQYVDILLYISILCLFSNLKCWGETWWDLQVRPLFTVFFFLSSARLNVRLCLSIRYRRPVVYTDLVLYRCFYQVFYVRWCNNKFGMQHRPAATLSLLSHWDAPQVGESLLPPTGRAENCSSTCTTTETDWRSVSSLCVCVCVCVCVCQEEVFMSPFKVKVMISLYCEMTVTSKTTEYLAKQ